jgi:hypothetical protein
MSQTRPIRRKPFNHTVEQRNTEEGKVAADFADERVIEKN